MKCFKNPFIEYLNINSLGKKIADLNVIMQDLTLDYFVTSTTKLDDNFPTFQLANSILLSMRWHQGEIEISMVVEWKFDWIC